MNTTIFVLLMIWSTSSSQGGVAVVQQEFNTLAACEAAREAMVKAHNGIGRSLGAHGCFPKG